MVAPGADSSRIAVDFDGIDSVRVNQTGDLILIAGGAEIRQHAPEVYQEIDGARRAVAAKYVMRRAHQVGFEIGAYDVARPLVIDPVLVYSTYLSGTGDDVANGIIADAAGNVYLAGMTTSADFPTANARQAFGGQRDVFVAKLDPTGSQLVYYTYLGGTGSDTVRTRSRHRRQHRHEPDGHRRWRGRRSRCGHRRASGAGREHASDLDRSRGIA